MGLEKPEGADVERHEPVLSFGLLRFFEARRGALDLFRSAQPNVGRGVAEFLRDIEAAKRLIREY